jgi:hypothetical protein
MKKKILISLFVLTFISPVIVIFCLYRLAMATVLPGRKGGPQDAFRHTYSTALTSRYFSPVVVEFVTFICERDPSNHFDQMDIHNNKIGSRIGLDKGDLYETVMNKIKEGQINASDNNVITWLPESEWDHGF